MLVNSLETVLEQEVERFKKLVKVVLTSLRTLNKAIEGLVVMGEQQEEIYQGLMDNHVRHINITCFNPFYGNETFLGTPVVGGNSVPLTQTPCFVGQRS